MAGTGVAVAGVAVAAVAVFTTGGGAPGKDIQVAGTAPTSVPAASIDCSGDPAERFAPVVTGLLAEYVPSTQFDPPAMTFWGNEGGCGVEVTSPFTGAGPNTGVSVMLTNDGDLTEQDPSYQRTSETPRQDGSVVRVYQKVDGPEQVAVVYLRPDGHTARATSTDASLSSLDQLTAIVTDPRLTF